MGSESKRIDLFISKDSDEYLEILKSNYGINKGSVLEKIIQEHKSMIANKNLSEIKSITKGSRSVINNLEQKVDILLNILNAIALNENHNIYISPDKVKSPLYEKAETEVKSKKEKEMVEKRKRREHKW